MDNAGPTSTDNPDYDDSFDEVSEKSPIEKRKQTSDNIRSLTGSPPSATESRSTPGPDHDSDSEEDSEDDDTSAEMTEPAPKTNGHHVEEHVAAVDKADHDEKDEKAVKENNEDNEDVAPENKSTKSPLLTSHRLSTNSMNDVNLSDHKSEEEDDDDAFDTPPPLPEKDIQPSAPSDQAASKPPALPSRFAGFSASLPSVPWGPPPAAPPAKLAAPQANPPPPARKLTSPFSWLGRGSSSLSNPKPDIKSPPLSATSTTADRRNTTASISTIGSNPELTLKALETGADGTSGPQKPPARTSLRDRFKLLRLREEAGITALDESQSEDGGALAGLIGRSASLGLGIGSPNSVADEKDGGLAVSPGADATTLKSPKRAFTIDPNLAPGTVSGAASSPLTPIDWDFWQSVVNEGPQAVARTNPEELTQAFIGGIPQTIRGVIWQILANSKNEELEYTFKELVVRGTDKEFKDPFASSSASFTNGTGKEKESIASSASSIRSEHSAQGTSAFGLMSPSPSQERDPEALAKAQAAFLTERKQKAKEETAAIQKLEKMIKRDMGSRTSYSKYTTAAGLQEPLFNICKAYALYDEGVGYPQGMNFIAMPLLFNMPEDEAFCLLVRLMNKYGLRELFIQDMPGLHLHLYQFERLLEDLEPALYCHLNRRGVSPKLYATQWFLTMFAYRFPLQLVMRVYDLVLSEGLEGAILKFGMAVVQRNVTTLLGMNDMLALTNFLKEKIFDVYIDQAPTSKSILESGFFGNSGGSDNEIYRADLLVQDAAAVKVTPDMLNKYRVEWEEKVRFDKERETELENYRTTVASQSIKIRQLEERTEKSDTEHVQLASELVRVKVENEELQDKNESLQGQVEELRKVAESEAKNVEDKLQGEINQVKQRNTEVLNENHRLEDLMAQMEKDLVETKMKYAEINENYENLKQKWNDLRKALD